MRLFCLLSLFIASCTSNNTIDKLETSNYQLKDSINYVLKNVFIIPMNNDTLLINKDVLLKNGKIAKIVDAQEKYDGYTKIDLKGKFIMPTLSDAHVHLFEDESDLNKQLLLNLINGITRIRSMRGEWKHIELRKKFNKKKSIYPKMYLSTPVISKNYNFNENQLVDYIKSIKNDGFDFIKILGIKNKETFLKIDSLCKMNNVHIGGHFLQNISDSLLFNSNYNSFEHLGGLIDEQDKLDSRIDLIKRNDIYICPTLQWYAIGYGQYSIDDMTNQRGMEYIDSKIKNDWVEKSTHYRENLGKEAFENEVSLYGKEMQERYAVLNRLDKEGVNLLLSPDSSSKFIVPGFGVFEEMMLYRNAGLSNYNILKSVTINFANFFKDNSYGTIEEGKSTDFLILNDNPLENIAVLKDIEGIFYNNNYLSKEEIRNLSAKIISN